MKKYTFHSIGQDKMYLEVVLNLQINSQYIVFVSLLIKTFIAVVKGFLFRKPRTDHKSAVLLSCTHSIIYYFYCATTTYKALQYVIGLSINYYVIVR